MICPLERIPRDHLTFWQRLFVHVAHFFATANKTNSVCN